MVGNEIERRFIDNSLPVKLHLFFTYFFPIFVDIPAIFDVFNHKDMKSALMLIKKWLVVQIQTQYIYIFNSLYFAYFLLRSLILTLIKVTFNISRNVVRCMVNTKNCISCKYVITMVTR